MLMKVRITRKKMIIYGVLIGLFILGVIALWNQPIYRFYTVETEQIPEGKSIRILQISDLHSANYGKNQSKIISMVDDTNPDIIVLTGDVIDDRKEFENAYILIEDLVNKYPVYFVSGNHEHFNTRPGKHFRRLKEMGVTVLEDESIVLNTDGVFINMMGIMDPERTHTIEETIVITESLNELNFQDEMLNIVLTHRPEYIEIYKDYPVDVVFAGHAHGGQVRIPFILNGLYSPSQGIFPKYAGGLYEEDGVNMIVSRGLSFYPMIPRVFNPPEVVVVDINGK